MTNDGSNFGAKIMLFLLLYANKQHELHKFHQLLAIHIALFTTFVTKFTNEQHYGHRQ